MRHSRRIDWSSAHIRVDNDGLKEFSTLVERVFGLHGETSAILVCMELLQFIERTFQSHFTVERYLQELLTWMAAHGKTLLTMTTEDFRQAFLAIDEIRRLEYLQKKAQGAIHGPGPDEDEDEGEGTTPVMKPGGGGPKKPQGKKIVNGGKSPKKSVNGGKSLKKPASKLPGIKKKVNPGGKKPN